MSVYPCRCSDQTGLECFSLLLINAQNAPKKSKKERKFWGFDSPTATFPCEEKRLCLSSQEVEHVISSGQNGLRRRVKASVGGAVEPVCRPHSQD